MNIILNPYRGKGLPADCGLMAGELALHPSHAWYLFGLCPKRARTPLHTRADLATELSIQAVYLKDESQRLGLGSFKALGATFAIAKFAERVVGDDIAYPEVAATALQGWTFVAASAGNHGLSLSAGARIFGAAAKIYLSKSVPKSFAERLQAMGAEVVIAGEDYEQSLAAAQAAVEAANSERCVLLADSTWPGCTSGVDVMEGYLVLAEELIFDLINAPPTHVFLQAGVGGLAAPLAARWRQTWGKKVHICVVEPEEARALQASISAGRPVHAAGDVSIMGRLDCKEPSHLALKALARDADSFMTLSDDQVSSCIAQLGLPTTPSGGAGFAGIYYARQAGALGLNSNSRALAIMSEGVIDA